MDNPDLPERPAGMIGSGYVELFESNLSKELLQRSVTKLWPDGVMFKDESLFDNYLDWTKQIEDRVKVYYKGFFQECYLGYDPELDIFIVGYDADDNHIPTIFKLKVVHGTDIDITDLHGYPCSMMYSANLRWLHKKYPELIDVRLD